MQLGDLMKDKITGFTGIATVRSEWLNGCVRFSLQPQKLDKEGKMPEHQTFDQEQLVVVKVNAAKITSKFTGGDRSPLSRAVTPTR